jgi:long-chain acyl-CoA synthetase
VNPDARQTLLRFLDDCASRGDELALAHWRGLRLSRCSYRRLAATAYQFARELEARRIGKGDRVLFWAANNPEWVAACFGCMLRGVVIVPLDRHSATDFVARVQKQVSAKLLLTDETVAGAADLPLPRLRLDDLGEHIARHATQPFRPENISEDDLIEIIFTSGTTAEPKGVCITHRNFLANLEPLAREIAKYRRWERLVHPIRFLSLLPLSHIFGQFMGIFVPQLLGGEVYFRESLNPSEIIETVHRHRISVIITFPRMLETLREKIERDAALRGRGGDFGRRLAAAAGRHPLRRMWMFRGLHCRFGWKFWAFISGGATLDPGALDFWQRLGFAVIQGYGMTETASIISIPHPFHMTPGSIGKALPSQELKLNEQGEILIRGANVAAGYWNGESVRPATDDEGWLHTGDIGERDADGNLFFRGREKDVIVTAAGMKVYPGDLEAALDQQPEIRESCVIGVEGARGPEPMAVLIPRDGAADLAMAVERANQALALHQQIRRWGVWPEAEFPRTTTTHKIIKRAVAEAIESREAGTATAPAASNFLLQQIARISGEAAPSNAGLKLDSLGRVELLSALEDHYQVELDEAAFTAATTVGEIEQMIRGGAPDATPYPYPAWAQTFPVTWIRSLVYHLLLLPITRGMCWVRVRGREHLHDVHGPVMFVSNHITAVDPALILSALPLRWRRRIAIAMIGEFLREWRYPPDSVRGLRRLVLRLKYGLVVALFNVFPLPQESGFRRSFEFAGAATDRGYSLLVFPEGRRTTDGRMNPFMAGTGLLARRLDVPVIPVKIDGLFALKRDRRYFARPGAVSVTFGNPCWFTEEQSPAEIAAWLQSSVESL